MTTQEFQSLVGSLRQEVNQLQKERDELKETVKRCWSALGIKTYSDAKPLTVWEHITELRRDKERCKHTQCIWSKGTVTLTQPTTTECL